MTVTHGSATALESTDDDKSALQVIELRSTDIAARPSESFIVDRLDDGKALRTWIEACARSKSRHTVRSYEKETFRFRIWLEHTYGSSERLFPRARADDANKYLDFLGNPALFPASLLARYNRTTQPFDGPLKPSSQAQAVTILSTMYERFREIEDLDGKPFATFNPFALLRGAASKAKPKLQEGAFVPNEKALPPDVWNLVVAYLDDAVDANPTSREAHRNRWVMHFLYETWLRREEAAKVKMNDFHCTPQGWELVTVGKGNKLRSILVLDSLLAALRQYREFLGWPPYPDKNDSRPAILPFRGNENVSAQTIYRICTVVLEALANKLEANPVEGQDYLPTLLRAAAPHWMRHTGASHMADNGADVKYVSNQLGHSDIRITANTYYHPDRSVMRAQMEAAAKKRKA